MPDAVSSAEGPPAVPPGVRDRREASRAVQ